MASFSLAGQLFLVLTESSDSAVEQDIQIPSDADLLSFDFRFANPGDGDWLAVRFDGELLYGFKGDTVPNEELRTVEIPLDGLEGRSGPLEVRLHGAGECNAEVLVGQLSFLELVPNSPPSVAAGPDQEVPANESCLGEVTLDGSGSSDPDGDELTYLWDTEEGDSYSGETPSIELPLGDHRITLTLDDGRGGSAQNTVTITVVDESPPVIEKLSASPDFLWPPDHKIVPVEVEARATDNCTEAIACEVASVGSSEPITSADPEDRSPDWSITGPLSLDLRAERLGQGPGRIYEIELECRDEADNVATGEASVDVPHDRRRP